MLWLLALAHAAPTTLAYTAQVLDGAGGRLSGVHDIDVVLYSVLEDGEPLWSEEHDGTTVVDGVVRLELGDTTPIPSDVLAVDTLYVEVLVDDVAVGPRNPVLATAYASVGLGLEPRASEPVACTSAEAGRIYFDTSSSEIRVCDGESYIAAASSPLGSGGSPAVSCLAIRDAGRTDNGVYILDPEQDGTTFQAYCDLQRAGGGWTLVGFLARNNNQENWAYNSTYWTTGTLQSADRLIPQVTAATDDFDIKGPGWGSVAGTEMFFRCSANYINGDFLLGDASSNFGHVEVGPFSSMANFFATTPANTPGTVQRDTGGTQSVLFNRSSGDRGRIAVDDGVNWGENGRDADGNCSAFFYVR